MVVKFKQFGDVVSASIYEPYSKSLNNNVIADSRHILSQKANAYRDYTVESLARAQGKFRRLARAYRWDFFFTLTFSPRDFKRDDYKATIGYVQMKFQQLRSIYPQFNWLYVVEQHKDGAYHIHGFLTFPKGLMRLRSAGFEGKRRLFYSEFFLSEFGYNRLTSLKGNFKRAVDYCLKYVSKSFTTSLGVHSYFHSQFESFEEIYEGKLAKDYENALHFLFYQRIKCFMGCRYLEISLDEFHDLKRYLWAYSHCNDDDDEFEVISVTNKQLSFLPDVQV